MCLLRMHSNVGYSVSLPGYHPECHHEAQVRSARCLPLSKWEKRPDVYQMLPESTAVIENTSRTSVRSTRRPRRLHRSCQPCKA